MTQSTIFPEFFTQYTYILYAVRNFSLMLMTYSAFHPAYSQWNFINSDLSNLIISNSKSEMQQCIKNIETEKQNQLIICVLHLMV